jgi:hypothetical protein
MDVPQLPVLGYKGIVVFLADTDKQGMLHLVIGIHTRPFD